METTLNGTPEALRSTAGSFSAKATQVKALQLIYTAKTLAICTAWMAVLKSGGMCYRSWLSASAK